MQVYINVRGGSSGGRCETKGGRICQRVGFKSGVKVMELWMYRVVKKLWVKE